MVKCAINREKTTLKKLCLILAALLLLSGVSTAVYANYGIYLRFFIYEKKQKKCKEGTLCTDASQYPQSIRVNNGSPYRYRCTGQIKVNVTEGDKMVTETLRIDEFIKMNASSFVIRKYAPGQKLSELDTKGVDCTTIY